LEKDFNIDVKIKLENDLALVSEFTIGIEIKAEYKPKTKKVEEKKLEKKVEKKENKEAKFEREIGEGLKRREGIQFFKKPVITKV
jgi:hypothetical protein